MKNLIVRSLESLMDLVFFIIVITPAFIWYFGGSVLGSKLAGLYGLFVGTGIAIVIAIIFTGVVYTLLSIDDSLRQLNEHMKSR